jgi:peptidoglycan/xylan/chitin deacetylase (PgdA/CDA1 family)
MNEGDTVKFRTWLAVAAAAAAVPIGTVAVQATPASAAAINNDCSGGYVTFTFDDGPDTTAGQGSQLVLDTMNSLNMKGVFFVNGYRFSDPGAIQIMKNEIASGNVLGNHTWDHYSFTGTSTGQPALTDAQITQELVSVDQALVANGLPATTLYRPPYGDINAHDDLLARNLGYRIVMPWGRLANIVDSQDWTGISAAQIASNVINGYTLNGFVYPGITANSIVAMHDADGTEIATAAALPTIAAYMNTKHLCSTTTVRPDATAGQVPMPAPPTPDQSLNLIQNPSLELLGKAAGNSGNTTSDGNEPLCFQQAGAGVGGNIANWSMTTDAHSGNLAQRVDVSNWISGDRKAVITQRASQQACLAAVTPGKTYSMWVWYKGQFLDQGVGMTKVSIATYYRTGTGGNAVWNYWQGGALMPATNSWNAAYFQTAPLPANATAISFGLAINGPGSLITDDYFMSVN